MPKLILEDVPPDEYARLQQLAAKKQQSVAEVAIQQSRQFLPDPPMLTEEISAPCDWPLPGKGVPVEAETVPMWFPDPPWFLETHRKSCTKLSHPLDRFRRAT